MKEIKINLFGFILVCIFLGLLLCLYWPCIFNGEHIYCSDKEHNGTIEFIRAFILVTSGVLLVTFSPFIICILMEISPEVTIKNPFHRQPFDESHPDYKYYQEFLKEKNEREAS